MTQTQQNTMPLVKVYEDSEPTLKEAQKFVGGYVELVDLENEGCFLVDEEGVLNVDSGLDPKKMSGSLTLGKNGNVLSANYASDYTGRFSSITMLKNSDVAKKERRTDGGSIAQKTVATVPLVLDDIRHRPLTLAASNSSDLSDENSLQIEAEWRMAMSMASVGTATVRVQGWFTQENELWRVGRLVYCDMPDLDMSTASYLIKAIQFEISDGGSFSNIELIHRDSFDTTDYDSKLKDEETGSSKQRFVDTEEDE